MPEAKGQQSNHEPSMEEILASIRRIIAEDGDGAAAPAPAAADKAATPSRQEDILELTDVVDESGSVVSLSAQKAAPAPEPPPARAEPVVDLAPPRPAPPPAAPEPETAPMPDGEEDRLVSDATAAASIAALSQLATAGQRPTIDDLPLGDVAQTLEGLVRSMLKPMLKDWLDANLPQLVERLVHEEIQRMVRDIQRR
jgi:cell pole-organizing protein PopZ